MRLRIWLNQQSEPINHFDGFSSDFREACQTLHRDGGCFVRGDAASVHYTVWIPLHNIVRVELGTF